jgi:Uma2 family endonuclease
MVFEAPARHMTIEQFREYVELPENADRLFELINGEIIEVMPRRTSVSAFPHIISFAVRLFCQQNALMCNISGADGAYRIGNNVIAPDMAYKRTPMSDEYPDPEPPLLAVEVISPTDERSEINEKIAIYQQAGILLWVFNPRYQHVYVYAPGQPMRTLTADDVLEGGEVLPGFELSVRDIFDK